MTRSSTLARAERGAGRRGTDHNIERLAADHERARSFAGGLYASPGLSTDLASVETNIVHVEVRGGATSLQQVLERTRSAGVRFGQVNDSTIRAVTHLDLADSHVKEALAVLHQAAVAASQRVGERDNACLN